MTLLQIAGGQIQGRLEDQLHVFRGIPYAEPLVGRARWLPPVPRRKWNGVLDARHYGSACMQFDQKLIGPVVGARRKYLETIGELMPRQEGDDCLLLNVWTPTVDSNARRPVMVYIHGGGFTHGAADELYDASSFASKGVVAVVVQYRLGPLGFLHGHGLFDGKMCSDNRAFLDQILALRWVQENIERFGGEPSNVTVFGESAGAFSVYQLAASPLAKGLFKRAIAMSGMPYAFAKAAEHRQLAADALGDVGVSPGNSDALAALSRAHLRRLQSALSKRIFRKDAADRYGSIGRVKWSYLGAAVETDFLPSNPLTVYEAGTPNGIDMMLGTCGDDGQLFSFILPVAALSAWFFSRYLRGLMPNRDVGSLIALYGALMPTSPTRQIREAINNDAFFRMPTLVAAEAHARGHSGRTYLYEVRYPSSISGVRAIHGIDIALLFGPSSPLKKMLPPGAMTAELSDQMLSACVAFAATGKPSAHGLPHWLPFEDRARNAMVFDVPTRVEPDQGQSVRRFWSNSLNWIPSDTTGSGVKP